MKFGMYTYKSPDGFKSDDYIVNIGINIESIGVVTVKAFWVIVTLSSGFDIELRCVDKVEAMSLFSRISADLNRISSIEIRENGKSKFKG